MKFNPDIINIIICNEGYRTTEEEAQNDPGKGSWFGISPVEWPKEYAEISKLNIWQAQYDYAVNFYLINFWNVINGDKVLAENDLLAVHLLDEAVNTGQVSAVKLLQELIRTKIPGQLVTGHLRNETMYNISMIPERILSELFIQTRINYYHELTDTDRMFLQNKRNKLLITQEEYNNRDVYLNKQLRGWLQRVQDTTDYFTGKKKIVMPH